MLKGHNYGECKKCGKHHGSHPRGMLGKTHSEETKQKMRILGKGKGVKHNLSPEGRASIGLANKLRVCNETPEERLKYGKGVRGKPSHRRGMRLPCLHILHIAEGLRESKIFKKAIREFHLEKSRREVSKFYNLSENMVFFPVTLHEHKFARALVEGHSPSLGLLTMSGFREHPPFGYDVKEVVDALVIDTENRVT